MELAQRHTLLRPEEVQCDFSGQASTLARLNAFMVACMGTHSAHSVSIFHYISFFYYTSFCSRYLAALVSIYAVLRASLPKVSPFEEQSRSFKTCPYSKQKERRIPLFARKDEERFLFSLQKCKQLSQDLGLKGCMFSFLEVTPLISRALRAVHSIWKWLLK